MEVISGSFSVHGLLTKGLGSDKLFQSHQLIFLIHKVIEKVLIIFAKMKRIKTDGKTID